MFKRWAGRLSAFAVIGALCTVAWLALFVAFRAVMPSLAANALALVITTIANTAANRRFTFGVVGSEGAMRHHLEAGIVFVVGLGLSSAGLGLVRLFASDAPRAVEVTAMLASYALATLVRFALLGGWVFHPRRLAAQLRGASGERGDHDVSPPHEGDDLAGSAAYVVLQDDGDRRVTATGGRS